MRVRAYNMGRWGCALIVWASTSVAFGQALASPPSPDPPAGSPGGDSLESRAARLRKMEEINQKLLQQYESIAKQNEALASQVRDLTKRLDGTAAPRRVDQVSAEIPVGADPTAPSLSESAARPSRVPSGGSTGVSMTGGGTPGGTAGAAVTGPDGTAPSLSESAARPSRIPSGGTKSRISLDAFYDQQRYGYILQSRDQEFELRFNALLQADARLYANSHQSPVVSDLDIPRMRMYFSGRLTKPIEYQISFQRSTNNFDVLNAYLNLNLDTRFQLRFGRYKAPYTYEWYKISIWEMLAPDRSLFGLNYGPNRMIGLMGWGFLFDERLEYAVGVFDGQRNSYQDTNNSKDIMALIDYKPFYQTDSPLKNLGLGGSFDQGHENNPPSPSVLRTSTPTSTSALSSTTGDNLIAIPFLAFNNNVRERGDRSLGELHATYI